MPTPTGSGPVSFVSLTGDNDIDSLLHTSKWGGGAWASGDLTADFAGIGAGLGDSLQLHSPKHGIALRS